MFLPVSRRFPKYAFFAGITCPRMPPGIWLDLLKTADDADKRGSRLIAAFLLPLGLANGHRLSRLAGL